MLKLRKVAITGGIASGKSTVCRLFQEYNAFIVDTDALVHELLSNTSVKEKIISAFGQEVCIKDQIDRKKLANKVFQEQEQLRKLESIIHPYVFKKLHEMYQTIKKKNIYKYFVVEIPLLFETNKQKEFDFVICVTALDPVIAKRKKKPIKHVAQRKKRMIPLQEKIALSDYVMENNASIHDLKKQLQQIIQDMDAKKQ